MLFHVCFFYILFKSEFQSILRNEATGKKKSQNFLNNNAYK